MIWHLICSNTPEKSIRNWMSLTFCFILLKYNKLRLVNVVGRIRTHPALALLYTIDLQRRTGVLLYPCVNTRTNKDICFRNLWWFNVSSMVKTPRILCIFHAEKIISFEYTFSKSAKLTCFEPPFHNFQLIFDFW